MTELLKVLEGIDKALYKPVDLSNIGQLLKSCRDVLVQQETTIAQLNKRPVRVLRLLEYVGDRQWVEQAIAKRGVKGTYDVGYRGHINEAIIGEFPEAVKNEHD